MGFPRNKLFEEFSKPIVIRLFKPSTLPVYAELPPYMEERSGGMRTGVGLEEDADILERRCVGSVGSGDLVRGG